MTRIYEQFDKATGNFTGVALIWGGAVVGRIVLKHGAAVTAYVQVWGVEMVKGRATGGGYDRATAAIEAAVKDLRRLSAPAGDFATQMALNAFCSAFDGADGREWAPRLERCGFTVARVM